MKIKKIINEIQEEIKSYVNASYPSCSVCGRVFFTKQELFCEKCNNKLEWNEGNTCIICGRSLKDNMNSVICSLCEEDDIFFTQGVSLLMYNKYSKTVINKIKDRGRKELALKFGRLMGEKLKLNKFCSDIDLIIPIPLHNEKLKKRGYNQAFMLAKGVGDKIGVDVAEDVLIKTKQTREQKSLSKYERKGNLVNSFKIINEEKIKGKNVLIVDDVFTTGQTINLSSEMLLESGASEVYFASLASTEDEE